VKSTVKLGGKTYKITSIAASAFKNNKKITSVTIGKNVEKIGAKAFYGCKNLKKVTVKSKVLKSVGKKALKGTTSKAVIKVPSAKAKAYKKLFAKSGMSKKAVVK
jgi:hypothetical protein